MVKKILVVDDEEDIRNLVGLWLKGAGYEVVMAKDGNECIDKLKSEKVDLILLDLMMPGPKPPEVLEGIRANAKNTPVLYLTAVEWMKETDEQKSGGFTPVMEKPVVGYILKPTEKEKLLAKIKDALG